MTKLHAGGKFDNDSYKVSGGLHGVGVSVVNALSTRVDVEIKRDGEKFEIGFAGRDKCRDLEKTGKVGLKNTGTAIRFWPDPSYFDSPNFSVPVKACLACQGSSLSRSNGPIP